MKQKDTLKFQAWNPREHSMFTKLALLTLLVVSSTCVAQPTPAFPPTPPNPARQGESVLHFWVRLAFGVETPAGSEHSFFQGLAADVAVTLGAVSTPSIYPTKHFVSDPTTGVVVEVFPTLITRSDTSLKGVNLEVQLLSTSRYASTSELFSTLRLSIIAASRANTPLSKYQFDLDFVYVEDDEGEQDTVGKYFQSDPKTSAPLSSEAERGETKETSTTQIVNWTLGAIIVVCIAIVSVMVYRKKKRDLGTKDQAVKASEPKGNEGQDESRSHRVGRQRSNSGMIWAFNSEIDSSAYSLQRQKEKAEKGELSDKSASEQPPTFSTSSMHSEALRSIEVSGGGAFFAKSLSTSGKEALDASAVHVPKRLPSFKSNCYRGITTSFSQPPHEEYVIQDYDKESSTDCS